MRHLHFISGGSFLTWVLISFLFGVIVYTILSACDRGGRGGGK